MSDLKQPTEENKKQIPKYREKWTKIALNTDRCDRAKAESIIKEIYALRGKKPPKKFVWGDSPYQLVKSLRGTPNQIEFSDFLYGNHDASWCCSNDFYLNEVGHEDCRELEPLMRLAEHSGWWAPFENICYVSEKPTAIHLNEEGQFHCTTGPAVAYGDDIEANIYALENQEIPKEIFDLIFVNPVAKDILAIQNTEHRVLAMKYARMGGLEILDSLPSKVLDVSKAKAWDLPTEPEYSLLEIEITPDFTAKYLKMRNPSEPKWYYEAVKPQINTVNDAIFFRKERMYQTLNKVLGTNLKPQPPEKQKFKT